MVLFQAPALKRQCGFFVAVGLLVGCLYSAPGRGKTRAENGFPVQAVPFEKWLGKNCSGPACLAMVLNYWDARRSFSQRRILAEIHDSEKQEMDNSDMVLYPRTRGFASYSFRGDLDILKQVVGNGIPVIVLAVKEKESASWHYRVVIGYDEKNDQLIFHDPALGGRLALASRDFLKVGKPGNSEGPFCWMMVVVPAQRPFPFPALQHDPLTSINLAGAYYRRSDFMRARAELEKAGESGPFTLYCLAMASLKEGRAAEAEAYARQAISLDAGSAYAHDVLGLAYADQGRVDQALQSLSRALRLAPGEKSIEKHYQRVKALHGERARPDFQKKGGCK